ncbi:hypothetical protein [Nonomuraea soli]|uniref:Uncharacterized protein n=1 Tax=Nonomuraea soli TaxID=1032476 RepID=A0A7W0CQQ9_9ACTN|nr:hypothetical protein [Nonomuraea soli]MBA2895557.1 hypothetical protein [Nonomuraea soli]
MRPRPLLRTLTLLAVVVPAAWISSTGVDAWREPGPDPCERVHAHVTPALRAARDGFRAMLADTSQAAIAGGAEQVTRAAAVLSAQEPRRVCAGSAYAVAARAIGSHHRAVRTAALYGRLPRVHRRHIVQTLELVETALDVSR